VKLYRRDCLRIGATSGAGMALAGCSQIARRVVRPQAPTAVTLPPGPVDPTVRLLNRASYGPTAGEVSRVAKLGPDAYVTEQLNPDDDEPAVLATRVAALDVFILQPSELFDHRREEVIRQLQQAAILYAVYSPHQLRERMVEFWSNHFNIYALKGLGAWFLSGDQVQVIRKHALGRFPDLLRASSHSPAMLQYLDNQINSKMGTEGGGANENYARELLELHSLGVHGGYTQKDVQEVARCLTGWTVEDRFLRPRGRFRFDESRHDNGEKIVLGQRIPAGGGEQDGDRVLDIVAMHPSTAKFISGKICRYFLGDGAEAWTGRLADIYLKTGGDIKAMLRPLLLSAELLDGPPLMKRPFDFAVSAMRALSADTDGGKPMQEQLARMGQPLYHWPMPDGYPDRTAAWTGSLLARWNFAIALAGSAIGGTSVDFESLVKVAGRSSTMGIADLMVTLVHSRHPDSEDASRLRDSLRKHGLKAPPKRPDIAAARCAALALASPEFQWR
jgi:uncharacterized protein (DUF1800 family)